MNGVERSNDGVVLKSCPFCGSEKLKIDKKSKLYGHTAIARIENHTFSVRCNVCHARGGAVGGRVADFRYAKDDLPKGLTTDEELKQKAINAWNNRKPLERVIESLEEIKAEYKERAEEELNEFCLEMFHHYTDECYGMDKAIEIIKEEMM